MWRGPYHEKMATKFPSFGYFLWVKKTFFFHSSSGKTKGKKGGGKDRMRTAKPQNADQVPEVCT